MANHYPSRSFSKFNNEYNVLFAIMNFLVSEIVTYFYIFIVPFSRISAFMLAVPIFSLDAFNIRFRVMFSAVLTMLAVEIVDFNAELLSLGALVTEIIVQIFIGLFSGYILQIVNGAIAVGGQAISNSMGLGMANLMDPTLGNVPVISQILIILATLIFIVVDGHLVLIDILMQSFVVFPIGQIFSLNIIHNIFLEWSPLLFLGGLVISLPIMISVLLVNAGLGMITRSAPAMNIISVGFPAILLMGIILLLIALPGMLGRIEIFWQDGLNMINSFYQRI